MISSSDDVGTVPQAPTLILVVYIIRLVRSIASSTVQHICQRFDSLRPAVALGHRPAEVRKAVFRPIRFDPPESRHR